MPTPEFDYVVASKWASGEMRIYTYFTEIHRGTMEQAERFLDYVKSREPTAEWHIHRITFEQL